MPVRELLPTRLCCPSYGEAVRVEGGGYEGDKIMNETLAVGQAPERVASVGFQ